MPRSEVESCNRTVCFIEGTQIDVKGYEATHGAAQRFVSSHHGRRCTEPIWLFFGELLASLDVRNNTYEVP